MRMWISTRLLCLSCQVRQRLSKHTMCGYLRTNNTSNFIGLKIIFSQSKRGIQTSAAWFSKLARALCGRIKLPVSPILWKCVRSLSATSLWKGFPMCFLKVGDTNNKREGAMNKLTNVVHSGWMTKSPQEQKLQSPLKIFRAVSFRLPLTQAELTSISQTDLQLTETESTANIWIRGCHWLLIFSMDIANETKRTREQIDCWLLRWGPAPAGKLLCSPSAEQRPHPSVSLNSRRGHRSHDGVATQNRACMTKLLILPARL